jgi:TonB family protein
MSGLDAGPQPLKQPAPHYPLEARVDDQLGVAVVRGVIDASGKVENCEVVAQSQKAFGQSAYEAVSHWLYRPVTSKGRPATYRFEVPIIFTLEGASRTGDLDAWIFGFPQRPPAAIPPEFRYDAPPQPEDAPRPVYPEEQWISGAAGKATVTYALDATGRVVSLEINNASDPAFGLALAAVIQTWHFKPAKLEGKPVAALGRVRSDFDLYLPPEAADFRLREQIRQGRKFSGARELDAPLKPDHQESPKYPLALLKDKPAGEAVAEFVIDGDGWVHLPLIVSSTRAEFGWAAATAVAQWHFEPPRKKGQPVDVRVRVPFSFRQPTE